MSDHPRYGDLDALWRKTAGRCHLCHEPVDPHTYGLADVFGAETATVDHLVPQSHGGSDDHRNLLPAHLGCNASRGTGEVEDARWEMAGTKSVPLSSDARLGIGAVVTGGGALISGHLFAEADEFGQQRFNKKAAFWGGATALILTCAALS